MAEEDTDIPALREQLAILVSTGNYKEIIGVNLTHEQVWRLDEKEVIKHYKRYETSALREQLAILVSIGKCKEAIGVNLTHEQVRRLDEKEVIKHNKSYETYVGAKIIETLIGGFLSLSPKALIGSFLSLSAKALTSYWVVKHRQDEGTQTSDKGYDYPLFKFAK